MHFGRQVLMCLLKLFHSSSTKILCSEKLGYAKVTQSIESTANCNVRHGVVNAVINRLRLFENRVLRQVFFPKGGEVTEGLRRLHNENVCNLYSHQIFFD
jgi:hypothetical protein